MNTLLHWLTAPEWSQVVKTLLHSLWQGALIAVALVLIMRRLANPYARYRCSLVALAAIPVAGIITWAILNSFNHQPPLAPPPIATEAAAPPNLIPLNQSPVTKLIVFADHAPAPPQSRWTAWLALAWLVGAVVMLGRAGVKVAGAERLRRACQPLNHPQIAQLVTEARRAVGLARKIHVAVTDKLTSPAVVGVLVPTLILPLTLVTTLSPEQIRFILLHELAHIRRGDYFANLFQLFVEALLFFNPAVWWISHQVRREREACCDALAIELSGAPADYARTLVHVAENVLSPTPASATAFGGDREPSSLADRIQRLLVPGYRPSLRLTWRAMISAFVLGAALLVLSAEGTRVAVAELTKSPTQSTDQKETSSQESKLKLETASHPSENLNDFTPTSWPLDSDKHTLSGPENLGGMTDWRVDLSNMLPLPALQLNQAANAAAGDKMPFLGDLPWIGRLFTSSPMKSAATDFVQLSQLSTLNEEVRSKHNISDSLSIRFQDTAAGNDLVSAQLDRQNDRLAANDNVGSEKPSRIGESTTTSLLVRTYMVDPIRIRQGMESASPGSIAKTNVHEAVRTFFATLGVDLNPPKSVFFNERKGELLVQANKEELDVIESILQVLNRPIPQINVKARFVEIDSANANSFDLFLGTIPLNQIPTSKATEATSPKAGPSRSSAGNLPSQLTGILTDPQYRLVLRALENQKGVDILAEQEVTTASGRQAQTQTVEMKTVVNGVDLPTPGPGPKLPNNDPTNSLYQTRVLPFGPVLDVVPTVSADGYTIQLTVIPTVTEFLGYDDPGKVLPKLQAGSNDVFVLPLPRMRLRQVTTNAVVWDGQTLVLGVANDQIITKQTDGGFLEKKNPDVKKKQLLVFITATIVDPAGNRGNRPAPSQQQRW